MFFSKYVPQFYSRAIHYIEFCTKVFFVYYCSFSGLLTSGVWICKSPFFPGSGSHFKHDLAQSQMHLHKHSCQSLKKTKVMLRICNPALPEVVLQWLSIPGQDLYQKIQWVLQTWIGMVEITALSACRAREAVLWTFFPHVDENGHNYAGIDVSLFVDSSSAG